MACFQEQKKFQKKQKTKSSEYFENNFQILKKKNKTTKPGKKKKNNDLVWKASGDLDGKSRLDENHVPQVGGCLSADGQKTRVYENPCPRGVCTTGLQEGRPFWQFGRKTRLDENHVPTGRCLSGDGQRTRVYEKSMGTVPTFIERLTLTFIKEYVCMYVWNMYRTHDTYCKLQEK